MLGPQRVVESLCRRHTFECAKDRLRYSNAPVIPMGEIPCFGISSHSHTRSRRFPEHVKGMDTPITKG